MSTMDVSRRLLVQTAAGTSVYVSVMESLHVLAHTDVYVQIESERRHTGGYRNGCRRKRLGAHETKPMSDQEQMQKGTRHANVKPMSSGRVSCWCYN